MKLNAQTIIIAVFAIFGIVGFFLFARSSGSNSSSSATVVVWGTLPESMLRPIVEAETTKELTIQYVERNADTFERDLLEALAAGTGPDLFFISQDTALQYQKFIYEIPYQTYARRTYQNTFIDEANIFLTNTGVTAIPLVVDPLVMYYNRSLLSSAFITNPPQFWDELIAFAPRVTRRSDTGAIVQSAVSLGTADNIPHAKEILATLILQAGNPIIARAASGELEAVLNNSYGGVSNPTDSALRFYTSFSDSTKENYAWNASLPTSQQMFSNGDLALYLGFASELAAIRQRNANLNYDVTFVPQTRNSATKATYGNITGIAISKGTQDANAALTAAALLTSAEPVTTLSAQLGLPPVRRDLLAAQQGDATYLATFYNSAIISQGFADPNAAQTRAIFKRMVDTVNSRISDSYSAVQRATSDISSLLSPYNVTE